MNRFEAQVTKDDLEDFTESFLEKWIKNAPDDPCDDAPKATIMDLAYSTGFPKRYREEWERPSDEEWIHQLDRLTKRMKQGGNIAIIGNRGTGKTRLAAEAMRDVSRSKGYYMTAMSLFVRVRASYQGNGESEDRIIKEIANVKMLVIDEIQERGNSKWEDRLLTHILDKRYGAMLPTIIIANLKAAELTQCLGDSISSRISETGGILEMVGKSHRETE